MMNSYSLTNQPKRDTTESLFVIENHLTETFGAPDTSREEEKETYCRAG